MYNTLVNRPKHNHFNRHFQNYRMEPSAQIPTNILEANDHFEIQMAIAGYSKEDIDIQVVDHILKVSGQAPINDGTINYRRMEFQLKEFKRQFTLPDSVSLENIEAAFNNGILSIKIQKLPIAQPIKINVK